MIALKNISFQYRRRPLLFDELNLELEPGSIYGLLAPDIPVIQLVDPWFYDLMFWTEEGDYYRG